MKNTDKQQYLEERKNLIKGCIVKDIVTEQQGNRVSLQRLVLSKNGDEFLVLPFNWKELHIEQVFWGE